MENAMQRAAQCQCGAVKAQTDAEPQAVVACSCGWCQRRSGSPIGVLAYFQRENVRFPARPLSLFALEEAVTHSATISAVSAAHQFIASAIVLRNLLAWRLGRSPIPIFQSPHVQCLRTRSMRGWGSVLKSLATYRDATVRWPGSTHPKNALR